MSRFAFKLASALSLALLSGASHAGVTDKKEAITLDGARYVIATAAAEARRVNAPGAVIAVVDDGGNLVALERLDNTFAAGSAIATGKARTAALFKRPTKAFEQTVNNGRTAMVALPDFTPLEGGVPIVAEGQVVGAIGVSGAASAAQDEQLAQAGAGALAAKVPSKSEPVTYLDRSQVAAAFAKGAPMLETPEYKVHASRREKPGQVEVHEHETDVVYVVEGSATFVTGGTVTNGKTVSPGEIRGDGIDGGVERVITKGDVIVVPRGVPHWFKATDNPFLYFVVKPIHP